MRNPTNLPGWKTALVLTGVVAGVAAVTWPDRLTVVCLTTILLFVLAHLGWVQWHRYPRDLGALAATASFAGAFAIAAGVDVVTLKGDIVRMNTVFKFSLQAWQLFAIASSFGAWFVLGFVRVTLPGRSFLGRLASSLVRVSAVALGAVTLIFMISGTPSRLDARFPGDSHGLDGLAYLEEATYAEDAGTPDTRDDRVLALRDDRPLIEWLRENVEGSPVIVEAVGPLYHWTGRISMNTGLPAVIGWDWHQVQQRWTYSAQIAERRQETANFYRSPDIPSAERYLRKYNVSYVIVGTEELVYGSPAALARLATIPALTEVFRSGPYAIYRVDQSKLPPPALAVRAAP